MIKNNIPEYGYCYLKLRMGLLLADQNGREITPREVAEKRIMSHQEFESIKNTTKDFGYDKK